MSGEQSGRSVVVVGGGVAGTTAALSLAARGRQVTLLERRPRLGGAAYSFLREGSPVDTGQHVVLRCYDHYRDHLARLGETAHLELQERMDIPVLGRDGTAGRLRRGRLPRAPLHLAGTLLGYRLLDPAARLRVVAGMAALARLDVEDPRLDEERFGDWLVRHGQRPAEVEALWGLLTVAALNIDVHDASLALATRVFRTALLEDTAAADLGMLTVPLSQVHDRAAGRALAAAGVRTLVREPVTAVDPRGDSFVVRTGSGEVPADAVVLAVPHPQAAALVPAGASSRSEAWAGLEAAPILNVHLRFERPVTGLRLAATLDPVVPWFFDRTAVVGGPGQYVVTSVSAAEAVAAASAGSLVEQTTEALSRLLPAVRDARLLDAFVTREPHATFRQRAGTAGLRPNARTAVPGLVLAGAWTATGWPDTLEGAARSGQTAAEALLDDAAARDRRTNRTNRTNSTDSTDSTDSMDREVAPR